MKLYPFNYVQGKQSLDYARDTRFGIAKNAYR